MAAGLDSPQGLNGRGRRARRLIGGARIKRADLINFCFHLEQLASAGVPIVEDPASDPATFAEKARKLVVGDKCVSVFGSYTSASRKAGSAPRLATAADARRAAVDAL